MKIVHRSPQILLLAGSPVGVGWSLFSLVLGLTFAIGGSLIARILILQSNWFGGIMIALGACLGLVFLGVGVWGLTTREVLKLDQSSRRGSHWVENFLGLRSAKPLTFSLEACDHVALSQRVESRSNGSGEGRMQADILSADLRIRAEKGRGSRSIKLDETENGADARVERVANDVASFLGIELRRDQAEVVEA